MVKVRMLSTLDDGRVNNFDFLRFLAASLVIFSHCYALVSGRLGSFEPLVLLSNKFISFGTLAVDVFFVVSGYLITRSLFQRKDLLVFLEARFLRLAPALFVANLLVVFGIGLNVSELPMKRYLLDAAPWLYAVCNTALWHMQETLPGVFNNNPFPNIVNGSLWTLPAEVKMYMSVFILGVAGVFVRPRTLVPLCVLVWVFFTIVAWSMAEPLAMNEPTTLSRLAPYFMMGGIAFLLRRAIPISLVLTALCWVVVPLFFGLFFFKAVFSIAIVYSVLVFAYHPRLALFNNFAKHGDFSYGLYIYGFPLQQTIVCLFPHLSLYSFFIVSYGVTLLCAFLSWHGIEKHALALKGFLPWEIKGRLVMKTESLDGRI